MRAALAALAVALGAATAAGATPGISFFRTPSGNIGCVWAAAETGFPANLRCDIRSGLKPRPRQPASCDLDYGDSVELTKTGRTTIVCHGDTALDPHAPVLAYGKTWLHDGFKCLSQTTGLRCSNASGHGFSLSRERWSRF